MKKEELTGREKRRRRRIKSQIMAYTASALIVALAVVGVAFGVRAVIRGVHSYNEKINSALADAEISASQAAQEAEREEAASQQTQTLPQENEAQENPLDALVLSLLQEMTTEEKIAGMFLVSPEEITGVGKVVQAGEGTKKALEENPVGGILYSDKNFKSEEQFAEMIANTKSYAGYPLFLAVQRESDGSKDFGIEGTPKASEMTKEEEVRGVFEGIGDKLSSYGINMNLAPVADVVSEEGNTSLQGRTFGSDAAAAAPLVSAASDALQEKGISAVLKKFPGEGSIDIRQGAKISKTLEELKNSEFLTYQAAIADGVDCIMVSNAKAPEVTGGETPCSMSSVVIQDVLRNTLGFQGIVMTDMMNDKNITAAYSDGDAAVAAILAGADMIAAPADYQKAYEGVLQAVHDGTITEERIQESLVRIYRVKYKHALDTAE